MQARSKSHYSRCGLLLLVLCLAPLSVPADYAGPLQLARGPTARGTSLNEAVQQVQQQTGGRVLSAETVNQGGRRVHRIKVLTPSGQVRVVTVDAGGR